MKKLSLLILLFASINTFAQPSNVDFFIETTKNIDNIPSGTKLAITNVSFESSIYAANEIEWTFANPTQTLHITQGYYTKKLPLNIIVQNVQNIWDKHIIEEVIPSIFKDNTGDSKDIFQYELRREMEADALKYISLIKENNLELNDPYLETYIYSLISKIAPKYLLDGRPSNVNILIEQNPSINAGCYPNGTLVINSGLLAALHSEDELVAILSHEIAHYVLDHSIRNINKEIKRQKRAEFWAGVATVATAVAEGVVASQNNYYVPGAATASVAIMSTMIASDVCKQLGMEYNHSQEKEADLIATQILTLLGYNPNALATALSRIQKVYTEERNQAMYFSSYSHPSLINRIQNAGYPSDETNVQFEQIMSFAVTNTARMKYDNRRFRQCLPLVSQNIANGVATADDYILKANCLLALEDTPESNSNVLRLLAKAKELDNSNINIHKTEIIATLRSNQNENALTLINNYIELLHSMSEDLTNIHSDAMWARLKAFISNELNWALNMQVKVNGIINYTLLNTIDTNLGKKLNPQALTSDTTANPRDKEIHYSATKELNIKETCAGRTIISHMFNTDTGDGIIRCNSAITTIDSFTFYQKTSLCSIHIPLSVQVIEMGAFEDCVNLHSIYCPANTPPQGSQYMFQHNAPDRKVYVPTQSVEAYKSAEYWSDYANNIVGYDFNE